MPETITVSVTLGDRRLTIEGPPDFVQTEVRRLTDLIASGQTHAPVTEISNSSEKRSTERDLIAEKRPKGHSEHIAVLAFYMAETGKAEFLEEEMRRAYIRAGVKPPKVVGQAIRDAKDDHDFIELGSKRGSYKISQHGDSFVRFDLPRKE